jgi:hypothetical protein
MATFTEASVEVSITLFNDNGVGKIRISATSFLADGTPVRSSDFTLDISVLSAERQAGIVALYTDAIAYAKSQFAIP